MLKNTWSNMVVIGVFPLKTWYSFKENMNTSNKNKRILSKRRINMFFMINISQVCVLHQTYCRKWQFHIHFFDFDTQKNTVNIEHSVHGELHSARTRGCHKTSRQEVCNFGPTFTFIALSHTPSTAHQDPPSKSTELDSSECKPDITQYFNSISVITIDFYLLLF